MPTYQGFNTLVSAKSCFNGFVNTLAESSFGQKCANSSSTKVKTMKIHSRNTTTVKFKAVIHFYDCNCLLLFFHFSFSLV